MKIVDFKRITRYFGKSKEWEIIIIVSGIFLAALIVANSYIFWATGKDMTKPVVSEVLTQTLKRDLLENIFDNLVEKERRFNQDILIKPDVRDPSL